MKLSDLKGNFEVVEVPKKTAPTKLADLQGNFEIEAPKEEKGLIGKAFEAIDRYGAAPMRAAYGKFQDSALKKGMPTDVVGAAKAAYDQFGKDPAEAPTSEDLVRQNPIGRQAYRPAVKKAFSDLPVAYLPKKALGKFVGSEQAEDIIGSVPAKALEYLVGAETDPTSYIPGAAIEKVAGVAARPLRAAGKGAGVAAEKLAEKATGAARSIADKFKPGTGRELLDRGIVKAFGTPEGVASRATKELERAGEEIGAILKGLDEKGATIEQSKIIEALKSKRDALAAEEDTMDVADKLGKIIERFEKKASDVKTLSKVEKIKRGYQGKSNYNKPLSTQASKETAQTLRQLVEESAAALDPNAAKTFTDEKKLYGLLNPVIEGATKRANQLKQSPVGGLLDVATATAGSTIGSEPATKAASGIVAALARRFGAPRLASTAAVGTDKVSRGLINLADETKGILTGAKTIPGGSREKKKKKD